MARLRERQGLPFSEQIRRPLREWLAERPEAWPPPNLKGERPGRKRASTRKRP